MSILVNKIKMNLRISEYARWLHFGWNSDSPLSFYARSDHRKSKETFKQENEDGITFLYLIKFHPMRYRKGSKMGYLYSYIGFFYIMRWAFFNKLVPSSKLLISCCLVQISIIPVNTIFLKKKKDEIFNAHMSSHLKMGSMNLPEWNKNSVLWLIFWPPSQGHENKLLQFSDFSWWTKICL